MNPDIAYAVLPGGMWPKEEGRIHLGGEFCPHLAPTIAEIETAWTRAGAEGRAFTLVTSWLPPEALERMARILEELATRGPLEVTVNDWGLLRLMRRRGWPFVPALGRLLIKRVAGRAPGRPLPELYASSTPLRSSPFLDLVREFGVGRLEIDSAPDPTSLPESAAGFSLTLHRPYAFVTLTGRCPYRFDGRAWRSGPCSRPCLGAWAALERPEDGLRILARGCAQFVAEEVDAGSLHPLIDRVVVSNFPGEIS